MSFDFCPNCCLLALQLCELGVIVISQLYIIQSTPLDIARCLLFPDFHAWIKC